MAASLLKLGEPGMRALRAHPSPYAAEALAVHGCAAGSDMDWVNVLSGCSSRSAGSSSATRVLINTSFLVLTVLGRRRLLGYRRRVEFAAYDESFGEPLGRGITC